MMRWELVSFTDHLLGGFRDRGLRATFLTETVSRAMRCSTAAVIHADSLSRPRSAVIASLVDGESIAMDGCGPKRGRPPRRCGLNLSIVGEAIPTGLAEFAGAFQICLPRPPGLT